MLRFIKSKLRSKKWLNASLLLGIMLLVAVVSCHPMFMQGSLNKLLDMAFQDYITEENQYPVVLSREGSYETDSYTSVDAVEAKLTAYREKWLEYLEIDALESQMRLKLTGCGVNGSYGATNKYLDVSYLEDLEEHANIVKGTGLEEASVPEGVYPCLISTKQMDSYELTCGEILTFNTIDDNAGNPLKLLIVGIFEEADKTDIFWYQTAADFEKEVFVSREVFEELMAYSDFSAVTFNYNVMLDYTQIAGKNADDIRYYTKQFLKADERMSVNYLALLENYKADARTVSILLWVLEMPMLLLLLAFIYMVSGQILQMETGEIAMMKSRGISRAEIIRLYIGQSGILSAVGIILGIPVGLLLCKLTASTNSFLVFSLKDTSNYRLVWQVIPYSLAAAVVAIICMTIPVLGYSKLSIVQQKSGDKRQEAKLFWEKYFLDIILLALSAYLLYNYNHQKDLIAMNVMQGESLDPVIFINASLFMLACGLLVLRLIHYLVKLIYYIGRNRWKPAIYASFLQITRTFEKQGFISIFLVMTLAMGIFNSNMVRTINENKEQRITYDIGSDVTFLEYWVLTVFKPDPDTVDWLYYEPDFERFRGLVDDGICESITKVIEDNNVTISANGKKESQCTVMGINTKEFGETAYLKSGLNDTHWYNALNQLAGVSNGVIISRSVADRFDLSVGDVLSYSRLSPISTEEEMGSVSCSVVAIVDAWPSYNAKTYSYDTTADTASSQKSKTVEVINVYDTADETADTEEAEQGELVESDGYLIVCNYAFMINAFGQTPYHVWTKLAEGKESSDVEQYLSENEIVIDEFESVSDSMEEMHNSPLIQITNGMYTLGFLVAIILCLTGFLIYWITSIKQRELLFGIYRAMGMNMREINRMLINEQIFSSLLAVAGGIGVGVLSTVLFVKLVAIVYLPEAHNIALEIYTNGWDMVRLFIIIVIMFVVCLSVLRSLLSNMKIAQALKLGED